jgi:hypothetical protein
MIPEDNNSTLVSEEYKGKDDTGVMSNDGYTNAVDLKPLSLGSAEPLSAINTVSNLMLMLLISKIPMVYYHTKKP